MAALTTGALTLRDWAKRLDPDGQIAVIVELLSQSNEILKDMLWREGNLPTGHRTTMRTGLPSVAWRLLNQGTSPSKSRTAQVDEQCGMLDAWSEVDKALVELNGDAGAFRMSEARAFIEAMNQEMAGTLFYGNSGLTPAEFSGLSVRYSSSTATNGQNVIKAGGASTDNASIWLVAWGEETVTGIFPKGSSAGLQHFDYGEQTVQVETDIGTSRLRALQEQFVWRAGIALKDWRYVARICNIPMSSLDIGSPTDYPTIDLITFMEHALECLPGSLGTPVFYCNRTIRHWLKAQARAQVGRGGGLATHDVTGEKGPILTFEGVPIRRCDQLLINEDLVS